MDSIIENLTVDSGLREGCESATDLKAWFLTITSRDDGTKYSDFVKLQADKVLANAAKPDEEGVYSICGMRRMEVRRRSVARRKVQHWVH
ncbi:hypothetical protein CPB85DRAFT_1464177 [Mucidula mucida]|nr:hypothetical protein CPB85DRAFT_1464177 [Mucidula mucida]